MKIITLDQGSKDTPPSGDAFLTIAGQWLIAKMKVEEAQAELDAIATGLLELAPQGGQGNGVIVSVSNRKGSTKWANVSKQLMAVAQICDGGSSNADQIADQLTDALFDQVSLDCAMEIGARERLERPELREAIGLIANTLLPSDPFEKIKSDVVSLLMQKHGLPEVIAIQLFEDVSASTHISSDLIGELVVRHTGAPSVSASIKLASDAQDAYARILHEKDLVTERLPDIEPARSVANSNW